MILGLMFMGFSIVSAVITPRAVDAFMFDDRPGMVIRNVQVISKFIRNGEEFVYAFDYDKRPECYPPDGAGEVAYRIWIDDGKGVFERFVTVPTSTISYAVPQLHHRTTKISIPPLNPGVYMMQWHTKFTCKGASRVQENDGPMMPFEVLKAGI